MGNRDVYGITKTIEADQYWLSVSGGESPLLAWTRHKPAALQFTRRSDADGIKRLLQGGCCGSIKPLSRDARVERMECATGIGVSDYRPDWPIVHTPDDVRAVAEASRSWRVGVRYPLGVAWGTAPVVLLEGLAWLAFRRAYQPEPGSWPAGAVRAWHVEYDVFFAEALRVPREALTS